MRIAFSSARALVHASISARISSCALPGDMVSYCRVRAMRDFSTDAICSFCAAMRSVIPLDTRSARSPRDSADFPALSRPGVRPSLIRNSISTGFIVLFQHGLEKSRCALWLYGGRFFTASRFVIFFMSDCFVVRRVSEHHAQCLVIDTPQDMPYGPSCGR